MQDYEYDDYEMADEAPAADQSTDQDYELAKKKNKKTLILWSSVLGGVVLAGIIFIAVIFSVFNARKNMPQDITSDDYTEYLEYAKGTLDAKNDQEDNIITYTPNTLTENSISNNILSDRNVKAKANNKNYTNISITKKELLDPNGKVMNDAFDFIAHYNNENKNYLVRIYFNVTDKEGKTKKLLTQRRFNVNYQKILMVYDSSNNLIGGFSKAEITAKQGGSIESKIANIIGQEDLAQYGFYKTSSRIEKITDINQTQVAYASRGADLISEQGEGEVNTYRINFRFDPSNPSLDAVKGGGKAGNFQTWLKDGENIDDTGLGLLRNLIVDPIFKGQNIANLYTIQNEWYLMKGASQTAAPGSEEARLWNPSNPLNINKELIKDYLKTETIKLADGSTKQIKYYDLYFVATRTLDKVGLSYIDDNGVAQLISLQTRDLTGQETKVVIPTLPNKEDKFFAGFVPKNEEQKAKYNGLLKKGQEVTGLTPDPNSPYMEVEREYKDFKVFKFYFDHPELNQSAMSNNPELQKEFSLKLEDEETIQQKIEANRSSLFDKLRKYMPDLAGDMQYYTSDDTLIQLAKKASEVFTSGNELPVRVDLGRRYYRLNVKLEKYEGSISTAVDYSDNLQAQEALGIKRYPYVVGNNPKLNLSVFETFKNNYKFYNLSSDALKENGFDNTQEIAKNGETSVTVTIKLKAIDITFKDGNNKIKDNQLSNKDNYQYHFEETISQASLFDKLQYNKPANNIYELFKDENAKLFYDKAGTKVVANSDTKLDEAFIKNIDKERPTLELFFLSQVKKVKYTFNLMVENPNNTSTRDNKGQFEYELLYVDKETNFSVNNELKKKFEELLGSEKQYFNLETNSFKYQYNDDNTATNSVEINFKRQRIALRFETTHTFFNGTNHKKTVLLNNIVYGANLTEEQISDLKKQLSPANTVKANPEESLLAKFTLSQVTTGTTQLGEAGLRSYEQKTNNQEFKLVFKANTVRINVVVVPSDNDNNFGSDMAAHTQAMRADSNVSKYVISYNQFEVEEDFFPQERKLNLTSYNDGANDEPIGAQVKNLLKRDPKDDPEQRDFRGFAQVGSDDEVYNISRKASFTHYIKLSRRTITIEYKDIHNKNWTKPLAGDLSGLYLTTKTIYKKANSTNISESYPEVNESKSFQGWVMDDTLDKKTRKPGEDYPVLLSQVSGSEVKLVFSIREGNKEARIHTYFVLSNENNNEYDNALKNLTRDNLPDINLLTSQAKYFKRFVEGQSQDVYNYYKLSDDDINNYLAKFGNGYKLNDTLELDSAQTRVVSQGDALGNGFLINEDDNGKDISVIYYFKRKAFNVVFQSNINNEVLKAQSFFYGQSRENFDVPEYLESGRLRLLNTYSLNGEEKPWNENVLNYFKEEANKLQDNQNLTFVYNYEAKDLVKVTPKALDYDNPSQDLEGVNELPEASNEHPIDTDIQNTSLTKAILDSTPSKANYVFLGWYLDKEMRKLAFKNSKITSDTTLYAKFAKASYFGQAINSKVVIKDVTGGVSIEKINDLDLLGAQGGLLYIPAKINGKNVIEFGLTPSDSNISATDINQAIVNYIYLPKAVKNFRKGSFANAKALIQIRNLQEISNFVANNNITEVSDEMFLNANLLTNIPFNPANITMVGKAAFEGTGNISDTMFTNLSVVKESGFKNASFKFRLGSSLNQIEQYAFYNAGIYGELQNSLTEVPFRAFAYSKLEHFRASTITKLGVEAFANASLKSYDGGNNAVDAVDENESVFGGQFRNCYDLVDVNIKSFDTITKYMFYYCKSIIKLEFKDQMTIMGNFAFTYCENLSKVVMPSKVKYVGNRYHDIWDGDKLFAHTNLSEIDIPEIDNGIMGLYVFAHLRTKKLTINKKTNTRFQFGFYAFHNNKATKDDPFTYNFEGYYQNWIPFVVFSYNTYLRFNNQNKDVQLYSNYQYTSKGLIYDNTNIYANFPEWDGQYVNNRSTFAFGGAASKLDIVGDYTFPASITALSSHDGYGGGLWLGKVTGKVYLNNVSSMITSYFNPYYPFDNIPSPHYDFVENTHFTIDKVNGYFIKNGRIVASINDEYYAKQDVELSNDRFIDRDLYFTRNKITLRNYHHHHLLYGFANELYFDNKDGFITESAWLQNGIPADVFTYGGPNFYKYMYNTHAFYVRDRITFNPNFEELTNRRTVFSPSNRLAMNNEMDLHYFKGLVFFAHISNNKIKFNENLEHITWSAIPELRWYYYNILSNTDLNFYFENNVLTNYYTNFNIKANNLKLTGNTNKKIFASKIDLNTKFETGTNTNFFDNQNLYQVISNFKEGSSLKPMINKDIDVIQLDNVINWTNLGINEKNIIKATKIYEKDNIKYALTNNSYQGDPNIKEAVVIDSNREAKPSTINVPEQITYNGTTYKVVKVLSYAFAYQQSLKEITFPNTITAFGKGVLKDNIKLEKVVFKSNLKLLDKEFLANTPNLKSLIINNGLSEFEIGDGLLDNHNSLENISIPQTRTYRSRYNTIINRFNNEVVLGAKNSKLEFGILGIGEKAFKNTEINTINFPTSLKYINDEAFANSKLKGRLYLNDGLEEIKDRAFANISEDLELIVPQSITEISPNAFEGSSSVTLKFRGSKPTWYQVPSNVVVEENFQG